MRFLSCYLTTLQKLNHLSCQKHVFHVERIININAGCDKRYSTEKASKILLCLGLLLRSSSWFSALDWNITLLHDTMINEIKGKQRVRHGEVGSNKLEKKAGYQERYYRFHVFGCS